MHCVIPECLKDFSVKKYKYLKKKRCSKYVHTKTLLWMALRENYLGAAPRPSSLVCSAYLTRDSSPSLIFFVGFSVCMLRKYTNNINLFTQRIVFFSADLSALSPSALSHVDCVSWRFSDFQSLSLSLEIPTFYWNFILFFSEAFRECFSKFLNSWIFFPRKVHHDDVIFSPRPSWYDMFEQVLSHSHTHHVYATFFSIFIELSEKFFNFFMWKKFTCDEHVIFPEWFLIFFRLVTDCGQWSVFALCY